MSENKHLCAWRWLSLLQYRNLIAEYIFSDRKGIDFGGWRGPVQGNSIIVDIYPPGKFRQIGSFDDGELDYVFSSHTLEHLYQLKYEVSEINRVLRVGGKIIIIVPAYTCIRWRKMNTHGHLRSFALEGDKWTRLDKLFIEAGFKILLARYCWDNSIFLFGEKL